MTDVSLDLIERLRAKAEASTFAAEAQAFRAKADELSARRQRRARASDRPEPVPATAESVQDGLAQWRTPAWWLVQSGALGNRDSTSGLADTG